MYFTWGGRHGQHQRLSFGDSTSPLTPLLSGEDREPGAVVTCKKDGHQKEKKKKKKEGKSPHHSRGELGTLCLSDRGRVEAARIMILGELLREMLSFLVVYLNSTVHHAGYESLHHEQRWQIWV